MALKIKIFKKKRHFSIKNGVKNKIIATFSTFFYFFCRFLPSYTVSGLRTHQHYHFHWVAVNKYNFRCFNCPIFTMEHLWIPIVRSKIIGTIRLRQNFASFYPITIISSPYQRYSRALHFTWKLILKKVKKKTKKWRWKFSTSLLFMLYG